MTAEILRLKVARFRGLESITWRPSPGVNLILGGGDVGKSTLLEAIELLLYPSNYFVLSDTDYWRREVENGFEIEGVFRLPEQLLSQQAVMNWPWIWNGEDLLLPDPEDDNAVEVNSAAYVLRAQGTADLEISFEVLQPDGETAPLSVSLRRSIGLLRLLGDDRNERDLRLVQGSGLDRVVGDDGLRPRLGRELAGQDISSVLSEEKKEELAKLDEEFAARSLPTGLSLGIVGGPGASVGSLVGLTAQEDGVTLPLVTWGAGTRRLSSLAIADHLQRGHPITLVDEMERGLEPYRQRRLAATLSEGAGQVFVTTHSSTAISALADASLWFVDSSQRIGSISGDKSADHRRSDPEAFLARLPIVCEGDTEVGFASVILSHVLDVNLLDRGIHLSDAGGNEKALGLFEALLEGGVQVGGIVDNEGLFPGRWAAIKASVGNRLLQWPNGNLEEHVIPLFAGAHLDALIEDPAEELTGIRLRHLAERLGISAKDFASIAEVADHHLHEVIIAAATGHVPDETPPEDRKALKSQARSWFKSREGGRELAIKVIDLDVWPRLRQEMMPMIEAVASRLQIKVSDER